MCFRAFACIICVSSAMLTFRQPVQRLPSFILKCSLGYHYLCARSLHTLNSATSKTNRRLPLLSKQGYTTGKRCSIARSRNQRSRDRCRDEHSVILRPPTSRGVLAPEPRAQSARPIMSRRTVGAGARSRRDTKKKGAAAAAARLVS